MISMIGGDARPLLSSLLIHNRGHLVNSVLLLSISSHLQCPEYMTTEIIVDKKLEGLKCEG
jgi:hypothetical protein